MWTNRLLLENMIHQSASFVTLTYTETAAPTVTGKPLLKTLEPAHVKNFLKRLRKNSGIQFRYFLVGEYGDTTQRPHYHLALFGFPSCENQRTNHLNKRCCSPCEQIQNAWGMGGIDVGEITVQSAKYIAGYCEKKWKKEEQCQIRKTPTGMMKPVFLMDGRHREFHRMSLRPGIGAIAIKKLATPGEHSQRVINVLKSIDAPVVLRSNGRILPLGRYLRRKWREALGRPLDTPQPILGQYRAELSTMLKKDEQEKSSGLHGVKQKAAYHHWRKNSQKALSLESRAKIYSKGKTL